MLKETTEGEQRNTGHYQRGKEYNSYLKQLDITAVVLEVSR